ncbi:hypothetical protein KI387_038126, partial [Taxus chinensis]
IQVLSPPPTCQIFTYTNVKKAILAMNSSRVADEEGFQAEFFKHGLDTLNSYLVDLFNQVVCTGFPKSWSHHIIHPIHKSGPTSDPNNYRMIMVGHTFSKLYATVLHMQISEFLEQHHCRAKGQ